MNAVGPATKFRKSGCAVCCGNGLAADVVTATRIVDGIELVDEAIACRGRNAVGADGERIAIDMPFAFGSRPLIVPEVAHLVFARLASFIRFTGANFAAFVVSVARGIRSSSHGIRLTVRHVRDRITTSGKTSDQAQSNEVSMFHENQPWALNSKWEPLEYE